MNRFGPIVAGDQNVNPQTTTGHSKLDAVVDVREWHHRAPKLGTLDLRELAKIGQRELVFARKGAGFPSSTNSSLTLSHVPAFVALNGLSPGDEKFIQFLGISCGPAEHQDTDPRGPLTGVAQFALWQGGTNSILTMSTTEIAKLAKLVWRIPKQPVLEDPLGKGRVLAELVEYNPRAYFDPRTIHAQLCNIRLARKQAGGSASLLTARIDQQTIEDSKFAVLLWEKLRSIAYTMSIAYAESAAGRGKLSDVEKIEMAETFGLVKLSASTTAKKEEKLNRANAFEQAALDAVFQMKYNGHHSTYASGLTAFPPMHVDVQANGSEIQIASLQSKQVETLLFAMVDVFNRSQQDIIGYTTTGGRPGHPMDVVLFGK